jgi:hypothetical protein
MAGALMLVCMKSSSGHLVLGFDPKFKVWKEVDRWDDLTAKKLDWRLPQKTSGFSSNIVSAGEGLFHIKLAAKSRREKVWKRGVIRKNVSSEYQIRLHENKCMPWGRIIH